MNAKKETAYLKNFNSDPYIMYIPEELGHLYVKSFNK